jgi:hypothetical protein
VYDHAAQAAPMNVGFIDEELRISYIRNKEANQEE